jgi:hypothetical protein
MNLRTAVSCYFRSQPSRRQVDRTTLVVTRRVNCAAVGNPGVSGTWPTDSRSTAVFRMKRCFCPRSPGSRTLGPRHDWWGGRPRPQPAPWPALRVIERFDSSTEPREEGVPRRPGSLLHNRCRVPAAGGLSGGSGGHHGLGSRPAVARALAAPRRCPSPQPTVQRRTPPADANGASLETVARLPPPATKRFWDYPSQVDSHLRTLGRRHDWWGGRPRPQPAPWPARQVIERFDSSTEPREEGVPRRPGSLPHNQCRVPAAGELRGVGHSFLLRRHFCRPLAVARYASPKSARDLCRFELSAGPPAPAKNLNRVKGTQAT